MVSTSPTILKRTPLYPLHLAAGAKMVPFAGWEMPVQYKGIIEEHLAVRKNAGLFDVSHMGEIHISGPEACKFLDCMLTNDISQLAPGKALYSIMCYPHGGCVDDLIVYCLRKNDYILCVNASNVEKDVQWLKEKSRSFECIVDDVSANYAQIALQGPRALEVAERFFPHAQNVGKFCFERVGELIWSRTGYTGEDGFEVYGPPESIATLAQKLIAQPEVSWTGLGARDSLRLEAGYSLYGHEISENISPLEANLKFAVKLDKASDFIGKEPLARQQKEGVERKIVFFKLEDRRIARPGAEVRDEENKKVGEVVSGTFSPCLEKPIGSALVSIKAGKHLTVDIRGTQIPLLLSRPPLFK